MKRFLVLAVMGLIFTGISVIDFANSCGNTDWESVPLTGATAGVNCMIQCCAWAQWCEIPYLEFEGKSYESNIQVATLKVTYNLPVKLNFSGTKLTQCARNGSSIPNPDSIDTYYRPGNLRLKATASKPATWSENFTCSKGGKTYNIGIEGVLGDITDQAAGSYKSTVTVTVMPSICCETGYNWD